MTGFAKRSGRGKLEQLKNSRFIAGASQRTAGKCPGGLSLLDHSFSVDEHITHTFGIMIRIFECGVIDDRPRIEHHDIGEGTDAENPAIFHAGLMPPRWSCGGRLPPSPSISLRGRNVPAGAERCRPAAGGPTASSDLGSTDRPPLRRCQPRRRLASSPAAECLRGCSNR